MKLLCVSSRHTLQDNIISIFSTANQTSRENKDLEQRAFQEAKGIWEDLTKVHVNEVWHAPERNSYYWLGNLMPHIPKITFKCILRLFCHTHFMQRSEDVFLAKVTTEHAESGWWMLYRQAFICFLSDFIWSFKWKWITKCPSLKKQNKNKRKQNKTKQNKNKKQNKQTNKKQKQKTKYCLCRTSISRSVVLRLHTFIL